MRKRKKKASSLKTMVTSIPKGIWEDPRLFSYEVAKVIQPVLTTNAAGSLRFKFGNPAHPSCRVQSFSDDN